MSDTIPMQNDLDCIRKIAKHEPWQASEQHASGGFCFNILALVPLLVSAKPLEFLTWLPSVMDYSL